MMIAAVCRPRMLLAGFLRSPATEALLTGRKQLGSRAQNVGGCCSQCTLRVARMLESSTRFPQIQGDSKTQRNCWGFEEATINSGN